MVVEINKVENLRSKGLNLYRWRIRKEELS